MEGTSKLYSLIMLIIFAGSLVLLAYLEVGNISAYVCSSIKKIQKSSFSNSDMLIRLSITCSERKRV